MRSAPLVGDNGNYSSMHLGGKL
nr:serine protease 7 [Protobothrops elegans]